MDPELFRTVLLASLGAAGGLWIVSSLLTRVSGTWERELTDEEIEAGQRPERMTLGQMGPLVTGRRDVAGGYQEFSGILVGRTLRLTRRDHGVPSLVALGFPEAIAKQLDGEVTAKLKLRISGGGMFLKGSFTPQKVEFTHRPPKVTNAYFLQAQPRTYRRVQPIPLEQTTSTMVEEAAVDVGPA